MMTNLSSTAREIYHRFTRIRIRTALEKSSKAVLSAVRIVVSFLFACHGAPILFGVFGGVDGHGATAPYAPTRQSEYRPSGQSQPTPSNTPSQRS
ncbi:MAG: hypothetical protein ACRDQ4_05255 [Pseudonocardiaceae bacterium]